MKILVILFVCSTLVKAEKKCSFDNALKIQNEVVLTDFTSFDQLEFECNDTLNMDILTIHPTKKIILNERLKLNKINIIKNSRYFSIFFKNFNGFDLSTDPFKDVTIINYHKLLIIRYISFSYFNFMHKNISFNEQCDYSRIMETYWENYLFRGYLMVFELTSNKYSNNICPLAFRNSLLNCFRIDKISSNLMDKNEFIINDLNQVNSELLNSNINMLSIRIYRTNLTNKLLNEKVFRSLTFIEINGLIESIQDDVFKTFKLLKILAIRMQHIKNIFARNNKWLQYLNLNKIIKTQKITYDQAFFLILYQTFHREIFYSYPDEDFCYFYNFPFNQAVFPVLKPVTNSKCTCTELFLMQYSYYFKDQFHYDFIKSLKFYDSSHYYYEDHKIDFTTLNFEKCIDNIEERFKECDFHKRVSICKIEKIKENNDDYDSKAFYLTIDDWETFSKFIDLYLFITNKALSTICLFINIIVIIVTSSEKIAKEMKRTYNYLKIYTIFNCLYILILFTKFICFKEIIYCYNTTNSLNVQYFKFISIRIISNVLKTASNFTYIAFSISRYTSVINTKNKLLLIFKDTSLKSYFLILITFSILINIYTFFITGFIDENFLENPMSDSFRIQNIDDYSESFELTKLYLYRALNIIRIIFSDIISIIFVFIIDISLLIFIIKKLKKKETMTVTNRCNKFKLYKKKRKMKNSENKMTSLIVLNGINFILFKLPSAIVNFYGLIYVHDKTNELFQPNVSSFVICRRFRFCENVSELAQIFYLLSFLIQFFIFVKLDQNFHDIFFDLNSRLFNKIEKLFRLNNRILVTNSNNSTEVMRSQNNRISSN